MVCAIVGVSLVVYGSSRTRRAATDDTSAPSEIRQFTELADQLAEDVAKVANIRDRENMRVMLDTLRDVVAKTRRKRPQVAVVTASNLAEQLNIMRTIVGGYLDDQEYPNLRGAQERLSGYSNAFANFRHFAEERMAEPVSYTHLDVYKRQVLYHEQDSRQSTVLVIPCPFTTTSIFQIFLNPAN